MNLSDTLTLLALQLQMPPDELIRYAGEDTVGGYSNKVEDARWPIGSLWEVEGKVLYALVRILKPAHCVEIGSLRGCSTAHLATALSVNGSGRLTAVDIEPGSRDMFPKHLDSLVTGVLGDGIEWLAGQEDESINLLFEDSSHGADMCASIAGLCKTKLAPGGVMVMHDAAHNFAVYADGTSSPSDVGAEVCRGLDRALGSEYRVYLSEPSDCGFAVWKRKAELTPAQKLGIERPNVNPSNPIAVALGEMLNDEIDKFNAGQETDLDFEGGTPLKVKKKPGRKPKAQA